MKTSAMIVIGIVIVVLLGIVVFRFTSSSANASPGQYDEFAQCLTEKGVKMYGAFWCPHCENQKKLFGNSWKYVTYIECDPRGDNANPQLCESKGITGYPTWEFPESNELIPGEIPMRELAFRSGCQLTQ